MTWIKKKEKKKKEEGDGPWNLFCFKQFNIKFMRENGLKACF